METEEGEMEISFPDFADMDVEAAVGTSRHAYPERKRAFGEMMAVPTDVLSQLNVFAGNSLTDAASAGLVARLQELTDQFSAAIAAEHAKVACLIAPTPESHGGASARDGVLVAGIQVPPAAPMTSKDSTFRTNMPTWLNSDLLFDLLSLFAKIRCVGSFHVCIVLSRIEIELNQSGVGFEKEESNVAPRGRWNQRAQTKTVQHGGRHVHVRVSHPT
jgi:hypothetical protein